MISIRIPAHVLNGARKYALKVRQAAQPDKAVFAGWIRAAVILGMINNVARRVVFKDTGHADSGADRAAAHQRKRT
jgi:hypothetical protein